MYKPRVLKKGRRTIDEVDIIQVQKNTDDILMLTTAMKDRDDALSKKVEDLLTAVTPMIESYKAATKIGKWMSGLLVFLSIIIGVFMGFKQLIGPYIAKLLR